MLNTLKKWIFFLAVPLLFTACASSQDSVKNLPAQAPNDAINIPKIRLYAIQQAATGLGAQSALAWTAKGINASLEKDDLNLNQVFNFGALLLDKNVLPPVLSEGDDALAQDSPITLRLADKVYKIESPARFVTTAPSWREYLSMNYEEPERPNVTLLPRNSEEVKLWNQYYDEGWKDGAAQADQIFSENMGRMKRDYSGMILYRKLLAQNIVTAPFVAKSDLGVTGDVNQLRINDQVLRITATSELITDSNKWKSVVVPGTEGAIKKQGNAGTKTLE